MLYLEAAELAGALLLFGRARRDAPAADGANARTRGSQRSSWARR